MKAIRRSIKGDREPRHQSSNSIVHKSAIAIVPPKKVIKALYDYEPQNRNNQELGFRKGDFFHVLSRENDTEWYEACNPLVPDARGLVPVAFFEVIGKQGRQSSNSVTSAGGHDSGFSEKGTSGIGSPPSNMTKPTMHSRGPSVSRKAGAMVYGIVLYDFNAERPDELDAKMGEPIIVVAQSNPEWFVAKPIGRLGGPGLIPVSFVELKDSTTGRSVTDPLEAVKKAGVPRVEEWKKHAAEYKNSSISLGTITQTAQQQQVTAGMERMSIQNDGRPKQQAPRPQQSYPQQSYQSQKRNSTPLAPVSASVPRYCFDNDMYWFVIECQMEDGRWWELSRYYADFYDFQIQLLEAYPEEAGNRGKPRTLPFMPGPVAHVTDAISNGRRQNLDEYIRKIIEMPPHISKCMLVRNLFRPKTGQDFEIDPNALGEDYRLSGASQSSLQRTQSHTASRMSDASALTPNSSYAALPARPVHSRAPASYTANDGPSRSAPLLHTQASTLTQGSGASSMKHGSAIKIKVFFEDDIIAIRVPSDITFQALKDKLIDRLKVNEDIKLQYRDEVTLQRVDMRNDAHLEKALATNPRLQIQVEYASP